MALRPPPEKKVPKKTEEKSKEAGEDEKMKEDEEENAKEDGDVEEDSVAKGGRNSGDAVRRETLDKFLDVRRLATRIFAVDTPPRPYPLRYSP